MSCLAVKAVHLTGREHKDGVFLYGIVVEVDRVNTASLCKPDDFIESVHVRLTAVDGVVVEHVGQMLHAQTLTVEHIATNIIYVGKSLLHHNGNIFIKVYRIMQR